METRRKIYGIEKLRETWVVSEPIRKTMQGNRATGTSPEVAFRKALWAVGIRGFRKNVKKLPGKPDIAFIGKKLAIFVHGCFWHGCPECTRNIKPKTNAAYWQAKIESNQARDRANIEKLEAMGYRVLVIWECELKKGLEEAVQAVREALRI